MKVYEYNNPFSNDNLLLRVEFLGRAYIIRLAFSVEDTGYEFERPDVSPIIREMRRPDGTKIEEEDVAIVFEIFECLHEFDIEIKQLTTQLLNAEDRLAALCRF